MRVFAMVAVVAMVGCSGSDGGGNNGTDGGSPGQCDDTATQVCEKAVSCSTGHDGGQVVFLIAGVDGGLNGYGISMNNSDQTHCYNFLHLTCLGDGGASFTAACGPEASGLQCGTDPTYGNGVVIPPPCGQNL